MAGGPSHGLAMKSGRLVVPFNTFLAEKKVVTEVVETGCAGTPECSFFYSDKSLSLRYTITNTADPSDVQLSGASEGTKVLPLYTWAGGRSVVFYSDDHGETWHIGGQITDAVSSSENTVEEVFVNGKSELLMSFRVESADTHCRKMARSVDGGKSFLPYFEPHGQHGCIPDPTCQGSILSLFEGRVLLTSGPGSKKQRANLSIYYSVDGGERFDLLHQVRDGQSFYSDLVFLGGSPKAPKVGVMFEDSSGIFFVSGEVHVAELGSSEQEESAIGLSSLRDPYPGDVHSERSESAYSHTSRDPQLAPTIITA